MEKNQEPENELHSAFLNLKKDFSTLSETELNE